MQAQEANNFVEHMSNIENYLKFEIRLTVDWVLELLEFSGWVMFNLILQYKFLIKI